MRFACVAVLLTALPLAAPACERAFEPDLTQLMAADAVVIGRFGDLSGPAHARTAELLVTEVVWGDLSPGQLTVHWGWWTNTDPPDRVTDHPVLVPLVTDPPEARSGLTAPMGAEIPAILQPACHEAMILDPRSAVALALIGALDLPPVERAAAFEDIAAAHPLDWGHMDGWLIPEE